MGCGLAVAVPWLAPLAPRGPTPLRHGLGQLRLTSTRAAHSWRRRVALSGTVHKMCTLFSDPPPVVDNNSCNDSFPMYVIYEGLASTGMESIRPTRGREGQLLPDANHCEPREPVGSGRGCPRTLAVRARARPGQTRPGSPTRPARPRQPHCDCTSTGSPTGRQAQAWVQLEVPRSSTTSSG